MVCLGDEEWRVVAMGDDRPNEANMALLREMREARAAR